MTPSVANPPMLTERTALAPSLSGARILFVVAARSRTAGSAGDPCARRAERLAPSLAARGAVVSTLVPDAPTEILDAVRVFCPTLVITAGARLGRRLGVPGAILTSIWDAHALPSLLPAGASETGSSGEVLLFADPQWLVGESDVGAAAIAIGPILSNEEPRSQWRDPRVVGSVPWPRHRIQRLAQAALDRGARLDSAVPLTLVGAGADPYAAMGSGAIVGVPSNGAERVRWTRLADEGLCAMADADADDDTITRALASARSIASTQEHARRLATLGELAPDAIARLFTDLRAALAPTGKFPAAPFAVRRDAFVAYLESISPPSLDRDAVARIVAQGEALGMPTWIRDGEVWTDRYEAWNWIFRNSPTFFEADKAAHRRTRSRGGHVPEAAATRSCCVVADAAPRRRDLVQPQRYRVTTAFDIDTRGLERGTRLRAYLPYPLETETQTDRRVVAVAPSSAEGSLLAEAGLLYGAEVIVDGGPVCTVSCCVEITVHAIHAHGFARPERSRVERESVTAMIQRVGNATDDAFGRAFLVHDWILREGRYAKTKNRCLCASCCARDFARNKAGHCIVVAHAFCAYCAELGVQARPVRGVMLTYPRDERRGLYGCSVMGEPVIGHTWAEFLVPGVGWLPAEFDPLVIKAATERNVLDDESRRALVDDYAFYRDTYFGSIDNQRVVCSDACGALPSVVVHDGSRPRGERWSVLDPVRVRHRAEFEYA